MYPHNKNAMMPDFVIYIKILSIGFLLAETFNVGFMAGLSIQTLVDDIPGILICGWAFFIGLACLTYAVIRDGLQDLMRLLASRRFDLMLVLGIGILVSLKAKNHLAPLHEAVKKTPAELGLLIFVFLLTPIFVELVLFFCRPSRVELERDFLSDEDIKSEEEDVLKIRDRSKYFAESVLASDVNSKIVFGVDGPWGSGKTSFINLAELHWKKQKEIVVCRFEPLRYASEAEPDLAQRLIRDITDAIQRTIFIPEFRSVANRYSRILKGQPTISYLGMKLSLDQKDETIDELLDDIDAVLKRVRRRLIIIIDDLDRLDPKYINNVLFVTSRALSLTQATYVLCYDTEVLSQGKDDGARAREFLEKFVTVKQSLFVDVECILGFLEGAWKHRMPAAISPGVILSLGTILSEVAELLRGDNATEYFRMIGDLRKIKRFINAIILTKISKIDFETTDFFIQDLINLMLLYLLYPGVFRKVLVEETGGRKGGFSILLSNGKFENTDYFKGMVDQQDGPAQFLLRELFDAQKVCSYDLEEAEQRSRAGFNEPRFRNLEKYLNLIVKFLPPIPRDTYKFYHIAVQDILNNQPLLDVISRSHFSLREGEEPHEDFWRILLKNCHTLDSPIVDQIIDAIIEYLPNYARIADYQSRSNAVDSLLIVLDRAGWGRSFNERRMLPRDAHAEIAWRIYGEKNYREKGILGRLASNSRGVNGWYDLLLFRLHCAADRRSQLFNIQSGLILNENNQGVTDGLVTELSKNEMRRFSQEIFRHFSKNFIDIGRNFFKDAYQTPGIMYLGCDDLKSHIEANLKNQSVHEDIARSKIIVFVVYQLSNSFKPGRGVGCGYFDVEGAEDRGGIAERMNNYIFDVCFNCLNDEANILYFLDYCLMRLDSPINHVFNYEGYLATANSLAEGLDRNIIARYWNANSSLIRNFSDGYMDRLVHTSNYSVSYRDALPNVFKSLDDLAELEVRSEGEVDSVLE